MRREYLPNLLPMCFDFFRKPDAPPGPPRPRQHGPGEGHGPQVWQAEKDPRHRRTKGEGARLSDGHFFKVYNFMLRF